MSKLIAASLSLLFAGWLLAGTAPAEARAYGYYGDGYHHGYHHGYTQTTYKYDTVRRVSYSRHYRNVTHTRYVLNTHRIVHVTLIKPVRYVSVVTRIHNRNVAVYRNKNVFVSRYLPTRTIYSYKTVYGHRGYKTAYGYY